MEIKISASDLTFEWSGCKRCFWRKYREGVKKPRSAFPSVFGKIDKLQRGYWEGVSAKVISKALPDIPLETKVKRLKSQPIAVGKDLQIVLSGEMDLYGRNGVQAVILDAKCTGSLDQEKALFYAPQLQAYKYIVEYPAKGDPWPDVRFMGLLGLIPEGMDAQDTMIVSQQFFPVPSEGFRGFIRQVGELLAGPKPPAKEKCEWCAFHGDAE